MSGECNFATTNFKENVKGILVDLATTYNLEITQDFYINLHPKVKEHSLNLFKNGHYAQAIFESVKALNNCVKEKAQIIDKDLSDAMAKAFNENNPIIQLNDFINFKFYTPLMDFFIWINEFSTL